VLKFQHYKVIQFHFSLFPYIRCSYIKETCNSEFSHQQEFKNPLPANQMEADFHHLVS